MNDLLCLGFKAVITDAPVVWAVSDSSSRQSFEVLMVHHSMTIPQNILFELNLDVACYEPLVALYQV